MAQLSGAGYNDLLGMAAIMSSHVRFDDPNDAPDENLSSGFCPAGIVEGRQTDSSLGIR